MLQDVKKGLAAGLGAVDVTCAEGACCTSAPGGTSVALSIFVACGKRRDGGTV